MRDSAKRRTSDIFLVWSSIQIFFTSVKLECVPLHSHSRFEDNGYWEADDQEIGNDITRTHGNELSVTTSTFRSWVWDYLPVVAERLAFGESRDDYSNEGNG